MTELFAGGGGLSIGHVLVAATLTALGLLIGLARFSLQDDRLGRLIAIVKLTNTTDPAVREAAATALDKTGQRPPQPTEVPAGQPDPIPAQPSEHVDDVPV
ncbi:hypothetical protein [Nocardia ninae]|uniref:Uncharacterized protein n=1 Tax=Nocardia ninae NBRC 108245 TaxID=1210091 RepID=A0A511MNG6_9NOCA|nr:hypothetical protein [Nocardia ninae]GEM42153.1 hypothetical protein NN4_66720 [Nocardia ninae NBRC 108245]